MTSVLNTDYISVEFNKTESILEVIWKTPPTEEEFKYAVTIVYDSYLKLKFSGFLVDARQAGVLSEKIQNWASSEWLIRKDPTIPRKSRLKPYNYNIK